MQIRSLGPFGFFLARANVYPSHAERNFLQKIFTELKSRNVSFARVGNTMAGPPGRDGLAIPGVQTIDRHTFVLDLDADEETIFKNMKRSMRNKIRKTEKEGVRAYEVTGPEDVEEYAQLSKKTSDRIRSAGSIMEMPREFFMNVFHEMITPGKARLFVARHDKRLLSGVLCLVHGDTMLAYHAASTRDRSVTALHGPTACFWHAIQSARAGGWKRFDFGGCTPDLPASDPRYGVYFFKSQWGGKLERFHNGEIVLSQLGYQFQETVLKRVWKAAHPLLFKIRRSLRGSTG